MATEHFLIVWEEQASSFIWWGVFFELQGTVRVQGTG